MRIRGAVLAQLRSVYEDGSVAGMPDAQLLELFVSGEAPRSTLAFSSLVERHGPMVLRVCLATLRDEHDAEDAFQAVFLILMRKAGSLWVRDSLGPWLHAVAVRTASYARTQALRRRTHEARRAKSAQESIDMDMDMDMNDLASVVHEEVDRLPGGFRQAVVLCDLESLSHEEAARRLGWPIGTVKSRQARGRERLKSRLRRRGITAADSTLVPAFAPAQVAPSLIQTTATLASKAGEAGLSPASFLAKSLLRSMMMKRMLIGPFSIVAAGTLATGMVVLTGRMFAADGPAPAGRVQAASPAAPKVPRPPAGSVFQMHILADTKHDAGAVEGPGYRWFKVDPGQKPWLDGLITREDGAGGLMVLVKLDPQNLTERDFREVKDVADERGLPAISFILTKDAATRFGTLTRTHLPEDGGTFKYRLALIVEGAVVSTPMINSEIRNAGIIEFGEAKTPAETGRLVELLADAAAYNAPSLNTKAVADQAEAIRQAKAVDIPALEKANRVGFESSMTKEFVPSSADPRVVDSFRKALHPKEVPPSGGEVAAKVSFFHDDDLIRRIWVYEGGEWGFERPGTRWTTGADAELWRLVKSRLRR